MLHYFMVENTDVYSRGNLISEMLMKNNDEGHAAHCRMARTTITLRVIKRQDRRT